MLEALCLTVHDSGGDVLFPETVLMNDTNRAAPVVLDIVCNNLRHWRNIYADCSSIQRCIS